MKFSSFGTHLVLFATALNFALSGAAAPPPPPKGVAPLEIGSSAPDFTLPGIDGKDYSLADFADSEVLAVLFTCNHCPSAQGAEDRIQSLIDAFPREKFALVAISSSDPAGVRINELGFSIFDDSFEGMKLHAAHYGLTFPYVYDGETQATTRAYGALATPHIFIFDKSRKLRYSGRIDDSRFGDPSTVKEANARDAIQAILDGTEIKKPVTRAHGCSTKWAYKRDLVAKFDQEFRSQPVSVAMATPEKLKQLRANDTDKLRLINIWATWCGPCVAEMPDLVEIARQFETRGFDLITVSTDSPSDQESVQKMLQRFHAALPKMTAASVKEEGRETNNYIFQGDDIDELAEALDPSWAGVQPYSILVAPGGDIIYSHKGEIDPIELRTKIVEFLGRTY